MVQRDILKGAAVGGVVVIVSLAALSLVDPQQPGPRPLAAPELAATPDAEAAAPNLAPLAEVDGPARPVDPPLDLVKVLPTTALTSDQQPAALPSGAQPQPAPPASELAALDPPPLAPPSVVAADRAPSAGPVPTEGKAAVAAANRKADPPATRAAQGLEAPEPAAMFAPKALTQLEMSLDVPAQDEPASAALTEPLPLAGAVPGLAPPQTEAGLPAADPAGSPPPALPVAQTSQPGDMGAAASEAPWQQASGEEELSLPDLREAPPPPLAAEPQPSAEAPPQAVPPGLSRPPQLALDAGVASPPPDGPAAEAGLPLASRAGAAMGVAAPQVEANPPLIEPPPAAAVPLTPVAGETEPDTDPDRAAEAAMIRFAAVPSQPLDRPLLALVLLDDAGLAVDAPELQGLPYHISIALSADQPDAPARARAFRAAGHEVVILAPLAEGASAASTSQALATWLAVLPEAVAVMETQAGAMQRDPALALAIATEISKDGQGLVLFESGMNPVEVFVAPVEPAIAAIYRDIDGQGQNSRAILRFIEQAASRSGLDEPVVVLGRLQPETLAALSRWPGVARAASVSVVPVSAVLRRE